MEEQETVNQLVASLKGTVENPLAARNKGLTPEDLPNKPRQKSREKTQDSDGEVVADPRSSLEDQQANRDTASNSPPSAPDGHEGNQLEALYNHGQ